MEQLTESERKILDLERQWWQFSGTKEQRIREDLDLSLTQFYMRLNRMVDDPRVEAADPLLVRRVRRIRESRQASRSARRLGFVDTAQSTP